MKLYFSRKSIFKTASTMLAVFTLSGCAKLYSDKPILRTDVKANEVKQAVDSVNNQTIPESFSNALKASPVASATSLQELINNTKLDEILSQIKSNNLGLKIEKKQLSFAKDNNQRLQFQRYPSLNANLAGSAVSRQQTDPIRQINLDLTARWEIDVWGIVRDRIRGGDVDLFLNKIAVIDAEQSLMLNGISAWLNSIYQRELLKIANEELKLQKALVSSIKERVTLGLLDANEYDSCKRKIVSLNSRITEQERSVSSSLRKLVQLSSFFKIDDIERLVPSHLPSLLPLDSNHAPVSVLTRRTDMKKAYWLLVKSDLNARIAYHDQFPRLMLTASESSGGKSLASLLDFGKITSQLASNIARTLIGSDESVVQAEQQKLNADVQYLRYQQVILNVFHEVEQVLADYKSAELSLNRAEQEVTDAIADEKRVREKFLAGLSDFLQQQSAQKAVFAVKRSRAQAEYSLIVKRVELAKVLGYAY